MLTAADLEKRRKFLTASDVPSLFGHNPYKTAYDVYIEKTLPVNASEAGEAAAIGNDLEDAMLNWGVREAGFDAQQLKRQFWAVAPNGIMAATIDGVIVPNGRVCSKYHHITHENDDCYLIPTLEGTMRFNRGDMLITGVQGEIYPCKRDIFDKTYEPAE